MARKKVNKLNVEDLSTGAEEIAVHNKSSRELARDLGLEPIEDGDELVFQPQYELLDVVTILASLSRQDARFIYRASQYLRKQQLLLDKVNIKENS